MEIKTFIKQNARRILLALFLVIIAVSVALALRKMSNHSLVIGHPDNIVVISPNESQDVIIIGDPDHVKVKPRNNK